MLHSGSVLAAFRRLMPALALTVSLLSPLPAFAAGDVADALHRLLDPGGEPHIGRHALGEVQALRTAYAARDYAPLWIDTGGATDRARSLAALLAQSGRDGLNPDDYAAAAIEARLDAQLPLRRAELELLLSNSLIEYLTDLRHGRLGPRLAHPELFDQPRPVEAAAILDAIAAGDEIAAMASAHRPANPVYRGLRRALAQYRIIAAAGGWPTLPDGPALRPGMHDERVAILRQHLATRGDITVPVADEALYDAGLEAAVRRFQLRHGLTADAVVGPRSRAALNTPVDVRLRQIELNMERWRLMPDDLGRRHVLVNLAGFDLDMVEDGSVIRHMRVVVGRTYRKTPIFSDQISYLEFSPTWTVPPGIIANDLLPRLRKDPGYLAANHFIVYAGWGDDARVLDPAQIDWHRVPARGFPYRLVQAPGPTNALGRVKFMFPNKHHVYLHDTPSREHFALDVRAFSSGCIRLEHPLQLAHDLLARDGWDPARIEEATRRSRPMQVRLSEPVPVHLTYSTAWIGANGLVHFREDIYGRDHILAAALPRQGTGLDDPTAGNGPLQP